MLIRPVLLALVIALLGAGGASARPHAFGTVTITPDQSGLVEGDSVTFTVIGDDAGWVKVYCTQPAGMVGPDFRPGGTVHWPGAWYYPFYGYYARVVLDVPDMVDTQQPMTCEAHYLDFLGYKGHDCGTFYPPVISACTRTKELGSVSFGVGHL